MTWLRESGLINVHNVNHSITHYTLTDIGRLRAILYSKDIDVDKKYKIYDQEITWF